MGDVDSMRVATDAMANHGRAWRLFIMAASQNLGCVKLSADELTTNFSSGPWAEKYPPILRVLHFYRDRLIRWFFEGEGRRGA